MFYDPGYTVKPVAFRSPSGHDTRPSRQSHITPYPLNGNKWKRILCVFIWGDTRSSLSWIKTPNLNNRSRVSPLKFSSYYIFIG